MLLEFALEQSVLDRSPFLVGDQRDQQDSQCFIPPLAPDPIPQLLLKENNNVKQSKNFQDLCQEKLSAREPGRCFALALKTGQDMVL